MRGVLGLCLLAAGLTLASHSYVATDREAVLAELTRIVTGDVAAGSAMPEGSDPETGLETALDGNRNAPAAGLAGRGDNWFALGMRRHDGSSDTHPISRHDTAATSIAGTPRLLGPPVQVRRARAAIPASVRVAAGGWRTAVVPVSQDQSASAPGHSLTPRTDAERWHLAQDLQKELKRVGCYWGKIDGVWGKGSKYAMADFMARVNSTLPNEDPDYLVLALVAGHGGTVCGKDCPLGETRMSSGQCVPEAVIAHKLDEQQKLAKSKRSARIDNYEVVEATTLSETAIKTGTVTASRRQPLPGRMTVGAVTRHSAPLAERPNLSSDAAVDPALTRKELQLSALPTDGPQSDQSAVPGTENSRRPKLESDEATARLRPDVRIQTTPPRVKPAVSNRRAKSKTKRRYSRGYHGRSVKSLFENPLGPM